MGRRRRTLLALPNIPNDNNGNQDLNAVHVVDTDGTVWETPDSRWETTARRCKCWRGLGIPRSRRNTLNSVFVMPGDAGLGGGKYREIWRWQGGGWNTVAAPGGVTDNLNGIYMLDDRWRRERG
jgi:hypothetical protein